MEAVIQERYGAPADVLELRDIDVPSPGDGEVLLRVSAAGISIGDWLVVSGMPYFARPGYGLTKPKQRVAGQEVAGRVEAVGPGVTRFAVGDEVFGFCDGAFAEMAVGAASSLAPVPDRASPPQAAAVPVSGTTALQAVRDAGAIGSGQRVLIVGASGGVGTFAVQIAKAFGADVTGVASTRNIDMVRKIGADRVIDYTNESITDVTQPFDLIVDTAGNTSIADLRSVLTPKGTLVIVGGSGSALSMGFGRTVLAAVISPFVGQQLRPFLAKRRAEDLDALSELIDSGELSPVIDRLFPLSDVAEAYDHVGRRHTHGKSIITV